MDDFLFRSNLMDIDRDVYDLTRFEAERQIRKLILIPSESTAPKAVRELLGSVFQNLYAEGYPDERMRLLSETEILDYDEQLAYYRRYSDPRYYKGVEYVDIIEALAQRRCAELFATNGLSADQLFVNVQPLSGAPANNAVYHLINPGDTVLGMNLLHGGHLTHGSSVNRSGKLYKIVHYNVDPETQQINYETLASLAIENKPKLIIAGYSSYPFVPDWKKFREIADSVGAYLLADISHIAGLVAAKEIPSPIGFAHVVSFTTHKTLCGPRGACLISDNATIAKKLDKAVFPGEQGGPHIHAVAALALTFKLAKSASFKSLQNQILKNCIALTERLKERGLVIPFGGTNTHLGNVDCSTIVGPDGTRLSGDMAARILDLAGIVLNRNTIPGDKSALAASGIRYGTPWMTQRGLKESDMHEVADIIADLLFATTPYSVDSRTGPVARAKIKFDVFEAAKIRVRKLSEKAGTDLELNNFSYPHFYYNDDKLQGDFVAYDITGKHVLPFINFAFSSDTEELVEGGHQSTSLYVDGKRIDGTLSCVTYEHYRFTSSVKDSNLSANWLRDLSDAFIQFDNDLLKRLPGPIVIKQSPKVEIVKNQNSYSLSLKPYFIGFDFEKKQLESKQKFEWTELESNEIKRTTLYDTHVKLGAKMIPFAGWEMPVWYSSVAEEHLATRKFAGLFDVSHMGVYQAEGPFALSFLDSVCANDISALDIGESCYTHFLTPDADVIDDLLVYRRQKEVYLVVVNASNDDKDWAWLNKVKNGEVLIDHARPWATTFGKNVILRNLRDKSAGAEMRVDIALQGPKSRDILLSLGVDSDTRKRIMKLKRTELCEAIVGGFDLVVSRTGYTGEKMAFELFVHPAQSPAFWDALMKNGEPMGLKPCGLGARDSLRTEAGLPLYGHEMGGDLNLGVSEANFASFVKTYKPWFIGRSSYLKREQLRKNIVVRFRFVEKGVRMAHNGDPVIDKKGKVIGVVTSCAIDSEGFLTGLAYIEEKANEEGALISIYQGSPETVGKQPNQLEIGDKIKLPSIAQIISRFPKL